MAVVSKPIPRALLAIAVAVLAFGAAIALSLQAGKKPTPAYGATMISINPGTVPTTATGFGDHECIANQGGGPFPGRDVWVFVLPGNPRTSGEFVSITAHFTDPQHAQHTITITTVTDPNNFNAGQPGTSKGWIIAPAGWTLTGAEATITGTARFFNLTHTCPAASGSPSPTPSMSHTPSPTPSMSHTPSPRPSHSHTPSPTPTHSPRPTPSHHGY